MSIPSLEKLAAEVAEAKAEHTHRQELLREELVTATRNGVPVTKASRAAGISRSTAIKWLAEADEH
jgi:transposase-like protein